MLVTAVVQIGNSDDKLTQNEWSNFIDIVNELIIRYQSGIHFYGFSIPNAAWQNACWVILIEKQDIIDLKKKLQATKAEFKQDSIAVTIGETEMV
jgi:hypothetical protein